LIFVPGLSTAAAVTTSAGRGVGMDIVRTNVGRVNGEISVSTEVGKGTRFTLRVPQTVVVSEALMVRVGSDILAIPLHAVKGVSTLQLDQVHTTGRTERVLVEDRPLELVRLDRVLAIARSEPIRETAVVTMRAGGRTVAVAVDEVLRKQEVVIKPLGAFLEEMSPFVGATVLADGRVMLVLDPARLIEVADYPTSLPEAAPIPAADEAVGSPPRSVAAARPQVLLVDDSISVRKFVGQMLERGGFMVLTASDGAEALEVLQGTSVDVVITDLEMPRLNGFDLVRYLRRRPATRE